jgi:hypothetical protein
VNWSSLPVYRHIKNEMVKQSGIRTATQRLVQLEIASYIDRNLHGNPKYDDLRRLTRFEYSVFSQFGEDGAIREIFRRIGETNRFFVELGAGDGVENNTAYLLGGNWRGVWIEGSAGHAASIRKTFAGELSAGKLSLWEGMIRAASVENVLAGLSIPDEPDLLSLDVDYNTYWIWQAIERLRPRVVAIEYNAAWPPPDDWVVAHDDSATWDGSSHTGASLSALCRLGAQKQYSLVGCSFAGSNAFFLRTDLADTRFCQPFTAENHYEPPRYFLHRDSGHRRGWGPFVSR